MREIEGAAAVIDGRATVDLRRPRARPLPAADPTHETGRGFHGPADAAVLLPHPPQHARRPARESTTPQAPARITSPSGSSTSGSFSGATRTTAATARQTSTRSSGRSARAGRTAWRAVEQDRLDYCGAVGPGGERLPAHWPRGMASTGPAGSCFVSPSLDDVVHRLQSRPARLHGPDQIPLKKAINYAIDRPGDDPRVRPPGRKAHRPDVPARARAPREHLPTRRRRTVTAARAGSRRLVSSRAKLVLYANNSSIGVVIAQMLVFNLRQIGDRGRGEVLRHGHRRPQRGRRRESRSISCSSAGGPTTPTAHHSSCRCSDRTARAARDELRPSRRVTGTDSRRSNRLTGEARRKAWADLDVDLMREQPTVGAGRATPRASHSSRAASVAFVEHPVYGLDFAAVCKKR